MTYYKRALIDKHLRELRMLEYDKQQSTNHHFCLFIPAASDDCTLKLD